VHAKVLLLEGSASLPSLKQTVDALSKVLPNAQRVELSGLAIQSPLTTVTQNGSRRKCEDFPSSLAGGVSIPSFEADRASGTPDQSILTLQFERKLLIKHKLSEEAK